MMGGWVMDREMTIALGAGLGFGGPSSIANLSPNISLREESLGKHRQHRPHRAPWGGRAIRHGRLRLTRYNNLIR